MDDFEAMLGDPGREVRFTVYADHTEMVRFWGKNDRGYEVVAGELGLSVHQIVTGGE